MTTDEPWKCRQLLVIGAQLARRTQCSGTNCFVRIAPKTRHNITLRYTQLECDLLANADRDATAHLARNPHIGWLWKTDLAVTLFEL